MSGIFEKGNTVRTMISIKDIDGIKTDPTPLKLKIKTPAGTTTTYLYGTNAEIVKNGTGIYHCDITLNAAGKWTYRWYSDGSIGVSKENVVVVYDTTT